MGKSTINGYKWPFSIAMLVHQRVPVCVCNLSIYRDLLLLYRYIYCYLYPSTCITILCLSIGIWGTSICGKWMIWGYPYFRKPPFIAVHIMRFSYLAMYLSIPVSLVKFHTVYTIFLCPIQVKTVILLLIAEEWFKFLGTGHWGTVSRFHRGQPGWFMDKIRGNQFLKPQSQEKGVL